MWDSLCYQQFCSNRICVNRLPLYIHFIWKYWHIYSTNPYIMNFPLPLKIHITSIHLGTMLCKYSRHLHKEMYMCKINIYLEYLFSLCFCLLLFCHFWFLFFLFHDCFLKSFTLTIPRTVWNGSLIFIKCSVIWLMLLILSFWKSL